MDATKKRQNYADDLEDAEALARAMVDDVGTALENFIANTEQHLFQIESFDKTARSANQLRVARAKAESLLDQINEMLETLGVRR